MTIQLITRLYPTRIYLSCQLVEVGLINVHDPPPVKEEATFVPPGQQGRGIHGGFSQQVNRLANQSPGRVPTRPPHDGVEIYICCTKTVFSETNVDWAYGETCSDLVIPNCQVVCERETLALISASCVSEKRIQRKTAPMSTLTFKIVVELQRWHVPVHRHVSPRWPQWDGLFATGPGLPILLGPDEAS